MGALSSYTFVGVSENHTIMAEFDYGTAPVIISRPILSASPNIPYVYDVDAIGIPDPIYQLIISPDRMAIDSINGMITWIPLEAGDYEVTVMARNSVGTYAQNFSIHVSSCLYLDGDVNNNHMVNGIDVVYAVNYFKGGPVPPYSCECTAGHTWFVAGDVNGSCSFNGIDIVYMVNYFKGPGDPPMPCPDCPPGGQDVSLGQDSESSVGEK
jgi:hypothetical protein